MYLSQIKVEYEEDETRSSLQRRVVHPVSQHGSDCIKVPSSRPGSHRSSQHSSYTIPVVEPIPVPAPQPSNYILPHALSTSSVSTTPAAQVFDYRCSNSLDPQASIQGIIDAGSSPPCSARLSNSSCVSHANFNSSYPSSSHSSLSRAGGSHSIPRDSGTHSENVENVENGESNENICVSMDCERGDNYVESRPALHDNLESQSGLLTEFSQMSMEEASPSQNLFNTEKDGDPRINWRMYYDFKVTKNEAYLELQEGYLLTQNYPFRIMTEKITKNGDKLHRCLQLNCTAKPFTRHYDLERHVKIHQADKSQVYCDYKRCPHNVPFRKDHCREHYREYHAEDVVKRGSPKSTKPMEGQKQSEPFEKFMSTRIGGLDLAWWRCTKCIIRVQVDDHSYVCPKCKQACEPVRVAWREKAHKVAKGEIVSPCGQCENKWVADVKNPDDWVPCPRCCKEGQ